MANAGKIRISTRLLLDWLQFESGCIVGANLDASARTVDLFIEHPDLPEVKEGDALPEVNISVTQNYDSEGHLISVNRTDPPKGG